MGRRLRALRHAHKGRKVPVGSLSLKDLCFAYDDDLVKARQHHRLDEGDVKDEDLVLKHLDLEVADGEFLCLVGHSGCGKSTTLRILAGLQKPLFGTIESNGTPIEGPGLDRSVVFQNYSLFPWMTVKKNVEFGINQASIELSRGLSKRDISDIADEYLAKVSMAKAADLYPYQLSGGMRKRAGLARALIAEPRILLCDEPTSGLDPITAARMDALLQAMHRQYPEMTIVVVSHDLASLRCIADHVLVLREGRAIFSGTLPELEASRDPYLLQFLRREGGDEESLADAPADPRVSAALDKWFRT